MVTMHNPENTNLYIMDYSKTEGLGFKAMILGFYFYMEKYDLTVFFL